MSRRKILTGLCAMCATVMCAVVASSAVALESTTGYTCRITASGVGEKFSDAHCNSPNTNGVFRHVEIPENTKTEAEATNNMTGEESEDAMLKGVAGGITVTLDATGVASTAGAWMENKKLGNGEHYATGEGKALFTGVTVVEPANCKVSGITGGVGAGKIETEQLRATTEGQGMFVKFEPVNAGKLITEFKIESSGAPPCPVAMTAKLYGSVKGVPNGATVLFTESDITSQGTLHLGSLLGPKFGFDGEATFKVRANSGEAMTALAPTTVVT